MAGQAPGHHFRQHGLEIVEVAVRDFEADLELFGDVEDVGAAGVDADDRPAIGDEFD